jgi:hypothetical protein
MIDDLRDSENGDAATLLRLEDSLKEGRYLEVAQAFKQQTRPDQFVAFLKAELDRPDLCSSTLHEVILKTAFRGIITTNFDMMFEHQSNRLQPLVYPQFLGDIDSFRRAGFFAKIHGCIRTTGNPAENLVLTEESYSLLRANPKYKTILHSLFVMHPVLTVGFSLRDPDFNGILADLREALGESTPTVYSLMFRPDEAAREEWRKMGVEIIPYADHDELLPFFRQLLALTEAKRGAPQISPTTQESKIDYEGLLENWAEAQKIEEVFELVAEQIRVLPNNAQKESFLFELLALMDRQDQICLAPHLTALLNEETSRALLSLFKGACKGNKWEAKTRLASLKPHALHLGVHRWVTTSWQNIVSQSWRGELEALFGWLLDPQWAQHGVDLWDTFLSLFNQIMSAHRRNPLSELYDACEQLEGAQDRIEKTVLAPAFVREDDSQRGLQCRWYKSWDEEVVRHVDQGRFQRVLNETKSNANYRDLVQLGQSEGYWRTVVKRLLTEYVHRTHLTLHSFSGEFNPAKAHELLDALSSVIDPQSQIEVLWEISHWPEEMRGLISRGEDFQSLREGLFLPLWWRYSSETRIKYLEGGAKRRMMDLMPDVGQEFLLNNMMGLSYDPDHDFREAFLVSSDAYKSRHREDGYNPNFLMRVWADRELGYDLSKETPPELIRRIATNRSASEDVEQDIWWEEAQRLADSVLREGQLSPYVSSEHNNYVVDNLLGAYFPDRSQIVLYDRMIELAAQDLNVECQALSTIVYMHETVHAFSHLGKDSDGFSWIDFSMPAPRQPELSLSMAHESIAQYYTFKLIEYLKDKRLERAFTVLEEHSQPVYRAWRATEDYTLEQMRQLLITLRRRGTDWPPKL